MTVINLELKEHRYKELRQALEGHELTVQVGIDFGSAIAGVIGHMTYQYDLCGDAVNTAARMCSGSEPGHVHVSEAAYSQLRGRFAATYRGTRVYKGKGEMHTYFLRNEPPPTAPPGAATPPGRPGAEDLDVRRALEESQGRSAVAEDRDLAHGLAESMETGAAPSDNTAFASPLPMPLALPWTERAARLVSEPRRSRSSANDLQPSLGRMVEGGSETDATQHLPNRASER